MMPKTGIPESSRAQTVRELRELIAAPDRRVPQVAAREVTSRLVTPPPNPPAQVNATHTSGSVGRGRPYGAGGLVPY